LSRIRSAIRSYIPEREEGQGLAEYGLILAGVALLAIVAIFALGPKIGALLNKVSSSLKLDEHRQHRSEDRRGGIECGSA
jgi:pilus assembly protein Flp/PilA